MADFDYLDDRKEPTLKEKVDKLYSVIESGDKKKIKKLKLPRKAKIGKSKLKKAFCGVLFVNENRTISGEQVQLEGGTYQTKDENYHVTNGNELFFWEGKYPVLWQRYDKLNPTNLLAKEDDKNEIYGQDLIKLRIKRDLIKEKGKMGMGWIKIVIFVVAGYFLIKFLFPKLLGGG